MGMNQKKMTIQQNQRRNVRDLRRQRIKLGGAQTHHRMLLEMVQGGLLAHIIEELLHHLIIIDIRLQEGAHQYLGMITQTMVSQIISTDRKDLHLLPQRNSMIVDQANMVTPPERAMVTLEKETMDQGIGIPQMPHITEMNIERGRGYAYRGRGRGYNHYQQDNRRHYYNEEHPPHNYARGNYHPEGSRRDQEAPQRSRSRNRSPMHHARSSKSPGKENETKTQSRNRDF